MHYSTWYYGVRTGIMNMNTNMNPVAQDVRVQILHVPEELVKSFP